jgi:PhnB protein
VTGVQPELWTASPREALEFYVAAFGARVVHLVGEGQDIVAQLEVEGGAFWVGSASEAIGRLDPLSAGGATSRLLLVVDDPEAVARRSVEAGATATSPVATEHGWLIGRITDPFGHEWEIGKPLVPWPPP